MDDWASISFDLTPGQRERLRVWLTTTAFPNAVAIQRRERRDLPQPLRQAFEDSWAIGRPYYGAAGAGVTVSFQISNLGVLASAKEPASGLSIMLSDLESI